MARSLLFIGIACTAAILTAEVEAQQTESQLPEVKVRAAPADEDPYGPAGGYEATRSATATKTDTPLHETPQAVTVVTRERIEDQGATSVQDALNYAAGARSDAYGLDSRADSVRVRGSEPSFYLDGLRRQLAGFYTSTSRVDPYLLERIELLRGPSSMLYGQGTTGGILNMVSKRPLAEEHREVGIQLGTFNRKQVQADLTGPLTADGQWLYRLVAVGRDSDTQVDDVRDDRLLVAPSLTWRPSAATTLTLQALAQRDRSGSTLQFFPWSGSGAPNPNGQIPTSRFVGQPGLDRYDSNRDELGWQLEHRFSDRWQVRQRTRWTSNEVDYLALYPDAYSNPGNSYLDPGQRILGRFGYFEHRKANTLSTDQHLQGRLLTGRVEHTLLLGLDTARHREDGQVSFDDPVGLGGGVPDIDVFSPVYAPYAPPPLAATPRNSLRHTGLYAQDQMKLGRWIAVLGIRRDRTVNRLEGSPDENDRATSRRAGLMYQLDNGLAPYASYSESFTPVTGTDLFGARFKPLRGEQAEVGFKYQPRGRHWSFNAAVYDLKEKNQLAPDPGNPLNSIQVGKTRNRGVELELIGQVSRRLEIAAHYNYIDPDPQLEQLPRHQASAWGTWRFAAGEMPARLGLGIRHMAAFQDGAAPQTPAVTLLDAMLGFDSGKWRYAVHAQNLADKTYVSTCLSRGDCFYGGRRSVILSARYSF